MLLRYQQIVMKLHKIYIIDDHQIVIDGIRLMLSGIEDMEVIGDHTDPIAALKEINAQTPDILICDVNMPGMGGIEVCKILRRDHPGIAILILTMMDNVHVLNELLATGVKGFVLKNKGKDELINAIRTVSSGNNFFSAEVMKQVLAASRSIQKQEKLTLREIEIIKLIASGQTTAQISKVLFISEHTVETHRRNILRKTNTHSGVELIIYARDNGIVS